MITILFIAFIIITAYCWWKCHNVENDVNAEIDELLERSERLVKTLKKEKNE